MVIANPISDTAFKFLKSDSKIARFFLETILEEEVVEVDLKPQELTYTRPTDTTTLAAALAVFRLDFVATIKTADNQYKTVLIEIQKARRHADFMRFRNYLGEHYKKQDELTTPTGKVTTMLPIVTIYILGFQLKELTSSLTKIGRHYFDQIAQAPIDRKSEFVKLLTHDCYVVQVPRIDDKMQSKVERLLSFFEQNYFIGEDGMIKEYPYPVEEGPMQLIADTLHFIGTDPERRSWLETEREAYRSYYVELEGIERELEESQHLVKLQAEVIDKKDKAIEQERTARLEKEQRLLEQEQQNLQLLRELEELKKRLG